MRSLSESWNESLGFLDRIGLKKAKSRRNVVRFMVIPTNMRKVLLSLRPEVAVNSPREGNAM